MTKTPKRRRWPTPLAPPWSAPDWPGLLILPSRRRNAKKELGEKLAELRTKLVSGLTEQFEREMKRGAQRIEDTVSPFGRFVRAEHDKISGQNEALMELEAHIMGLQAQLKREDLQRSADLQESRGAEVQR